MKRRRQLMTVAAFPAPLMALLGIVVILWWAVDAHVVTTSIRHVASALDLEPVPSTIDDLAEAVSFRLEKEKNLQDAQALLDRLPEAHRLQGFGKCPAYEFRLGPRYSIDLFGLGFYVYLSTGPRGVEAIFRSMPEDIKYL